MDLERGILAIDVGAGTQDILVWRPGAAMENCPKMVLPSATITIAGLIDRATEKGHHIFLSGKTMGGGPCSAAARRHVDAGLGVFALKEPALSFHDDLNKVKKMGIQIVEQRPAIEPLTELRMGDINPDALYCALSLFYVPLPGMVAVSVQDHGYSPTQSNRAFRFRQWEEMLRSGTGLESLLYQTPPDHLTRMKAVSEIVPGAWVMDTGASAILGALLDPWVEERKAEGITIVNIGNAHTVAALVKGLKIWGIYEHHTSLLDPFKLKDHLDRFRKEALTNQEIFDEMGHGCRTLSGARKVSTFEHLSITGPNRGKFTGLAGHMAAPFGDMMLTGCFGLLEAVKRRLETGHRKAECDGKGS
jgi:uncharacterized protein (DUF1786 family)